MVERALSILISIFRVLELILARWQGKGWGAIGVDYEVKMASRLLFSEPKICIDVGGNVGNYSRALLNKFPACQIIIFEPSQKNVEILNGAFSANEKVSIEPVALSNASGFSTLFSDTNGSGLASLTKRNLHHIQISFEVTERVKTQRFEDFWVEKLNSSRIDFLKLDVEGHELRVLQGCGEALKNIKVIQFEFGGTQIDTKTFFKDFWELFSENNFELFRIGPLGITKLQNYDESDECFMLNTYLAKNLKY
jgi:FkbM family methyltransferase